MVGMAGEGMSVIATFCDSIKKHMEEGKHPTFPFVAELMLYIRLISGANVVTDGPVRRIRWMKKPILFSAQPRGRLFRTGEGGGALRRLRSAEGAGMV